MMNYNIPYQLMRNVAAFASDSLQYSLQLVVIHNDNKQNILCNKFAYDQNVYYFQGVEPNPNLNREPVKTAFFR